jgi:hypothetical protein
MAPRETSTMANIAPVSIPTLPLGEILGVEEKRASVAEAEGVRIEVLIGIAGRMVNGGLELDTSAVVELCDSAVVLVINVERERDTAVLWQGSRLHCYNPPDSYPTDSSAERMTSNVMYSSCVRTADWHHCQNSTRSNTLMNKFHTVSFKMAL